MKKNLIILTLLFFVFNSQSQQVKNIEYKFSDQDYLKKSKKQKTTGFILLGGGTALFTGGVLAMQNSKSKGGNEVPFVMGGMAMVTTSIPFFIASLSSKHKAKLYMNKESIMISPQIKSGVTYNSIGMKISF
jgi:hypothetical protein